MSDHYTITDHTADEWRAMSQDCMKREAESFARCDTDGFMSQWASSQTARMYQYLAGWADGTGDVQRIPWVFDAETLRPVTEWSYVRGQYGESVRVFQRFDNGAHAVSWFHPSRARKAATAERNDRKKGFVWGWVSAFVTARTFSAGMNVSAAR